MSDAIKLSIKFFTEVKGFPRDPKGMVIADNNYKNLVMKSFEQLVAGGMSPTKMIEMMDSYRVDYKTPMEAYTMEDILTYYRVNAKKSQRKVDPDNLLEYGRFYYHPALQIAPPPPVIDVLPDGTFKASYEEDPNFYLEVKESFTLDDLADHFYKRCGITKQRSRQADKGAFKHILKSVDLDVILYAIDEAISCDDIPRTAFDIDNYFDQAELILDDRKNTLHMEGLDHVIPRS
jgi:hypothetical protein